MVANPKNAEEMPHEENKAALQYLMFLKKNWCGKIKGKGCAYEIKQRENLTKDEKSETTIVKQALFLIWLVDYIENIHVGTVYIRSAFMQENTEDETVHMKMEDMMVDILTKLDPELYQKYIWTEKVKSILSVELKVALYNTIHVTFLFWWNLTYR